MLVYECNAINQSSTFHAGLNQIQASLTEERGGACHFLTRSLMRDGTNVG
jgi:hypothetical protein